jgi:hypothetical protein
MKRCYQARTTQDVESGTNAAQPQPKTPRRYVFVSPEVDERDGIPGCVIAQYRRCGKARCRCARPGEPPHGPYFYHYWRGGGKARKRYIARDDAPRVTALCDRRRTRRANARATKRLIRQFDRLSSEMLALLERGRL